MLCGAGYDVVAVNDGHAAMECLLADDAPRLALLDWMMPGLDGPAVCSEVRRRLNRGYIYITVLTSRETKKDLVAALEAGADDYLTKPCNAEELKARLRVGCRILQLEDTLVAAREQMRFKATHDQLTSLFNRDAVLARLNLEIERVRHNGGAFSMLLCDVDHFKRINDTHGHLTGDQALRKIGVRLREELGRRDAVGRYGGEEFLVILNSCGLESVCYRAEAIRKAVNAGGFETKSGFVTLSMSIGALTVDSSNAGWRPETMLSQVDLALYRAKMEGRNRTVLAISHLAGDQGKFMAESCGTILMLSPGSSAAV
jgi:diguanylate cyclase (GGDEF)-like protein